MDFATAWDTLAIGATVTVSDGTAPPSTNTDGVPYKAWRSHNFTGTLAAKVPGDFRGMRFDLPPTENGSVVGYIITEAAEHSFAAG